MKGNSSKKVKTPTSKDLSEQYKSEASRVSASNLNKDKFSAQNMKEFKCEIDHEIAKCLDTLDRQGLKFLKQTLRASKLFGINTQELTDNIHIEESNESEEPSPEQTSEVKKSEPSKNIQIKKINKPDQQKKPTTAQRSRPIENKNDLGQRIQKKLESLNIKTGKKSDSKTQNTQIKPVAPQQIPKKQKSSQQIQEEIETEQNVCEFTEEDQKMKGSLPVQIQEEIKNSFVQPQIKVQQIIQESEVKQYKTESQQQSQRLTKIPGQKEDYQNLNPFGRKPNKKLNYLMSEKLQQHVTQEEEQKLRSILGKNKVQSQKKSDNDNAQQLQEEEEKTPIRKLRVVSEQNLHPNLNKIPVELMAIIDKIKKLPTNKIQKLQKVLQKFQDPNISTSMLSLGSEVEKQQISYMKPFVPAPFLRESGANERSKSRSRLEKQEKASSIKVSMARRNKESRIIEEFQVDQKSKKMEKSSRSQPQSLVLDSKIQQRQQRNEGDIKDRREDLPQTHDLQYYQTFRPKEEDLANSSQLINKSGTKLIKINKKKATVSSITLKVLSNNGHSSFVALSTIFLYNLSGEVIHLTENNFKQATPKLLKLFSQNSEGWLSNLSNASISIENINQSVGGIRVINFNKSELQNNKQADLIEILIDGQLHWRGQLRGGSFKEDQNYITDIKVAPRQFEFPMYYNQSLRKSFGQEKSLGSSWLNLKEKSHLKEEQHQKQVVWLEKQSISKIKELQDLDKNQSKVKRIQSIRNSQTSAPKQEFIIPPSANLNEDNLFKVEVPSPPKQSKSRFRQGNDILGELNKSMNNRKKTQMNPLPQQPHISKKEENRYDKEKQVEQERLRQKEKEQEEEFNEILKSLQKRGKESDSEMKQCVVQKQRVEQREKDIAKVNKGKQSANKCFEDFMKDSLFQDLHQLGKPATKPTFKPSIQEKSRQEKNRDEQSRKSIKNNIDDLIDELNDVIGTETQEQTGEQFMIPELPSGKELTMVMLSNWGNQQLIGLNGLQLFDSNGDSIKPIEIISSSMHSEQLIQKVFKSELMTTDESRQLKLPKNRKVVLLFVFAFKVELAAIRFWNFNGHRVHNNIGVKKCHLRLDNQYIFSGDIQQGSGSSEDAYKSCEYIIFTENAAILKKISEKDWLSLKKRNNQEQKMMFKSTLEHFHRPVTRNDEEMVKKEIVEMQKEQTIKLSKRMVSEYESPQLPEGFTLKFILHSSWGDRFFVGLNGIDIFNEKGEVITRQKLSQIVADPSSISKLQGYEGDKRVVTNLINGQNNNTRDTDIWLAPLLSDVQKIERGRSNIVIMDYTKSNKIAGINFYNYAKTPERGVREIEIYLDNYLLYRGYLRKYSQEEGIIHTTVNFTKQQALLEAMNYCSYNQDHLEQQVGLVNEEKVIKAGNVQVQQVQLSRPMTGKLLA